MVEKSASQMYTRNIVRIGVQLASMLSSFPATAAINQQAAVRAAQRKDCPAIDPMPHRMALKARHRDGDPTRTHIDQAKNVIQGPLRTMAALPADTVVRLADAYREERDPHRQGVLRSCLADAFATFAEQRSLEGAHSSVDNFYRSWLIARLAIAHMKVFGENPRAVSAATQAWFRRNTDGIIAFQEKRISRQQIQNHLYWGGFAAASVGRLLGHAKYQGFATKVFRIGIQEIDAQGLLAAEVMRGRKARHYHLFAAKPLIGLALINGRTLLLVEQQKLQLLTRNVVDSFDARDGGLIARVAHAEQDSEQKMGSLYIMEPFLDAEHRQKLQNIAKGSPRADPFLGGDIAFLLAYYSTVK